MVFQQCRDRSQLGCAKRTGLGSTDMVDADDPAGVNERLGAS
jgi:hypothetical protein